MCLLPGWVGEQSCPSWLLYGLFWRCFIALNWASDCLTCLQMRATLKAPAEYRPYAPWCHPRKMRIPRRSVPASRTWVLAHVSGMRGCAGVCLVVLGCVWILHAINYFKARQHPQSHLFNIARRISFNIVAILFTRMEIYKRLWHVKHCCLPSSGFLTFSSFDCLLYSWGRNYRKTILNYLQKVKKHG